MIISNACDNVNLILIMEEIFIIKLFTFKLVQIKKLYICLIIIEIYIINMK